MHDDLKKFGLRLRPRVIRPRQEDPEAAPFSWADADLHSSEERHSATGTHAKLELLEDAPGANAPIRHNAQGVSAGYNPYESGLLQPRKPKEKRDLRELSKWIEMQKKLGKPTR